MEDPSQNGNQNSNYEEVEDQNEQQDDNNNQDVDNNIPNEDSQDQDDIHQFANDQNKKLNQLIKEKRRVIRKINKQHQRDFQRKKILQEHLRNVDQQLLNTKGLIDQKNKQTETQNHLWQITQRQGGRLESQIKKYNKIIAQNEQRLNDNQVRIFRTNEKVEQIKLELNWNQQELEQWAITGKQKQQDNVILQKYRKEDDAKIRELNLQIEKLTIEAGRKQQQLDREITNTQTSQIQLDKTAQQFKKEHDQRHILFTKWQQVTKTITNRDDEINRIGQNFANLMDTINENNEILDERKKQFDTQKKLNRQEQARNVLGNRDISDRKNQLKRLEFERIANLQAQVEILKNQLSSFSTKLAQTRNAVTLKGQDLLQKKQRLQLQQAKFNALQTKLKNQLLLVQKFDVAKNEAQATFKDRQNEKKRVQNQISLQKDVLVRNTQQLTKFRQNQASLYGQIQGIMAACRNLQSHINKLNQQFQKQQQLLYNAEYQIQLMERKVARARGQRTLQQKKDLQKDVQTAQKGNDEMKRQYKILNESVKKLNQDLRAVDSKLIEVKGNQKKLSSGIQQLSLQNDMTIQALNKITKQKQDVLVKHDIMKLQIKKIKQNLNRATDHVYTLQNKKNQLQMTMQQRQKQIQVHRDVLLAEHKAIEDERHKIAIQLAQRKTKVKNLRIKYESLVQKAHGSEGGETEHTQAYYVIKASQERQELQRRGDQLSAKIIKAQKQLKGLQNTKFAIQNRNIIKRQMYADVGISKQDLAQKNAIQQQCNAASQNLFKKRNELKKIEQQYEQDMKRLTQTQNNYETLRDRKQKLEHALYSLGEELNQNQQKLLRADKSLDLMLKNVQKKKIEIPDTSPHLIQLQYDIENDKNKTIIRSMISLGQDLPELGMIIEEVLKENNVQVQSKIPSSVDLMSSRGSMSIKSGGSAISRSSKLSKK